MYVHIFFFLSLSLSFKARLQFDEYLTVTGYLSHIQCSFAYLLKDDDMLYIITVDQYNLLLDFRKKEKEENLTCL